MDDFGGTNGIFGDLPNVASRVAIASNDSDARTLAGTGISMEGIDQNPVYCESAPAPPTAARLAWWSSDPAAVVEQMSWSWIACGKSRAVGGPSTTPRPSSSTSASGAAASRWPRSRKPGPSSPTRHSAPAAASASAMLTAATSTRRGATGKAEATARGSGVADTRRRRSSPTRTR